MNENRKTPVENNFLRDPIGDSALIENTIYFLRNIFKFKKNQSTKIIKRGLIMKRFDVTIFHRFLYKIRKKVKQAKKRSKTEGFHFI